MTFEQYKEHLDRVVKNCDVFLGGRKRQSLELQFLLSIGLREGFVEVEVFQDEPVFKIVEPIHDTSIAGTL